MVLEMLYGHNVVATDDEYLTLVDKASEGITAVNAPGVMIVDFFPFCKMASCPYPWHRFIILQCDTSRGGSLVRLSSALQRRQRLPYGKLHYEPTSSRRLSMYVILHFERDLHR